MTKQDPTYKNIIVTVVASAVISVAGQLFNGYNQARDIPEIKMAVKDILNELKEQPKTYVLKQDYNEHCKFNESAHNNLQMQIGQSRHERRLHGNDITGQ